MSEQKFVNKINVDELMETIGRVRQNPELGRSCFRVKNRWLEGGHNETSIHGFYIAGQEDDSRDEPFVLEADEPPVLLGENRGPNPVEYLLTALAGCLTSSMVYHAAAHGIRIEELESEVEGEIDLRGFLGIEKEVKKGYQNIHVNFKVRSDASPEKLRELALFSPVFDTITSPVPVMVHVEKKEPVSKNWESKPAEAGVL
ncbi:MAG: OsmC family protein [Chthoniobacteraceae bacterium]|nr:OsmC family protein [Chthoniobacteraceae bacterium]